MPASTDFGTAVAAAWITAAFGTLLVWILSAGTDETFVASLLRIRPTQVPDADVDGVLFLQLDGVSFPVMHWALNSGTMPTLRRWVDGGSHALHEWIVQMPCTTPASQQAILQGTAAGVPAFRWYDRELGRVLVANRPDDAAIIESRASTGHGLLADDGVSISNLFTGDAPKASMTMSRLEVTPGLAAHPRGVRPLPAPPRWSLPQPLPDLRRDRPGTVPGGEAEAAGGVPERAPLMDVRRAAGLQPRPAP